MSEISYHGLPWPVRDEITAAQRQAWERLGRPGTWLTGAERIAIAAETRNAAHCALCRERKEALSPDAIEGSHDHLGGLPELEVEQIHRICTDPGRLTRAWYQDLVERRMGEERYVESIGVIATIVALDTFTKGLGMAPYPCRRFSRERRRLRAPLRPGGRWLGSRRSHQRMPWVRRTKIFMMARSRWPISCRP